MKNLESRVAQLESRVTTDEAHSVKVVFLNDGESAESARRRNDIASDFTGKVLAVSFVAAQSR
jgi:hypothetical protein